MIVTQSLEEVTSSSEATRGKLKCTKSGNQISQGSWSPSGLEERSRSSNAKQSIRQYCASLLILREGIFHNVDIKEGKHLLMKVVL